MSHGACPHRTQASSRIPAAGSLPVVPHLAGAAVVHVPSLPRSLSHHVQGATMSWSVTVDNLWELTELPVETLAKLSEDNPKYFGDAQLAFALAKQSDLVSATLAGGRTASPYGGPDTVVFSVVGFDSRNSGHAVPGFYQQVIENIVSGPLLSLKCKLYGDQQHAPCAGTIDDGTERPCECRCHARPGNV